MKHATDTGIRSENLCIWQCPTDSNLRTANVWSMICVNYHTHTQTRAHTHTLVNINISALFGYIISIIWWNYIGQVGLYVSWQQQK